MQIKETDKKNPQATKNGSFRLSRPSGIDDEGDEGGADDLTARTSFDVLRAERRNTQKKYICPKSVRIFPKYYRKECFISMHIFISTWTASIMWQPGGKFPPKGLRGSVQPRGTFGLYGKVLRIGLRTKYSLNARIPAQETGQHPSCGRRYVSTLEE